MSETNGNNSSLFGNLQKTGLGLFANNNQGGLFGNNNQNTGTGGLFGCGNQNTGTGGLFGCDNQNTSKNSLFTGGLFGNNINEKDNLEKKAKPRSNNIFNEEIEKCKHKDNYIAYCTKSMLLNKIGLLCYNCLYNYHKEDISQCIPIEYNNFENYKKFYKDCINKHKNILKDKFDEIISMLEKYENEEIEDIYDLLEQKINLDDELPIEIPFIDRFEFAIKKKIMSLLENSLFNSIYYRCNTLNLYKKNLNELKISQYNPNENEIIKFKSLTDFNLCGVGIPNNLNGEENSIAINFYTGNNTRWQMLTTFEKKENLSLGIFTSYKIHIKANEEYTIEFKGIKNLNYISNDEEYNKNSNITINSNNAETILACLLIELNDNHYFLIN